MEKMTKELFTERYLKEGVSFCTRTRNYLLHFGLKENRCEICGLNEWNGKELVIQVHHINGNRNDNRLENLQMLCPNCHSQTENFQSRNPHSYAGKEIVCLNCGKPFTSKYGDHKFCSNKCHTEYIVKTRRTKMSPYTTEYLRKLCEKCSSLEEIGFIIHKSRVTVKRYLVLHGLFEEFKKKRNFSTSPVIQYTSDGEFVKEWPSISDAQETLKIYHIPAVCKGKRKSAGGYLWKYKEEPISTSIEEGQNTVESTLSERVKILQYDVKGNYIQEFDTLKEASESTNTNMRSLALCLQGKHAQANSFIWKYREGEVALKIDASNVKHLSTTPVLMYDTNGKVVEEFSSIKEAAEITKLNKTSINRCLRGITKSAGGFIWRYKYYSKTPLDDKILNRPIPDKVFHSKVKVLQYDLNGNFIKEFNSMVEAAKETNSRYLGIVKCTRGEQDRTGNYMWKLKEGTIIPKINPYKPKPKRARPILQYDRQGNFVQEYLTMEEVLSSYNMSRGTLMKCLSNETKSYNGYIWRYKNKEVLHNIDVTNVVFDSTWNAPVLKCDLQGNILQEYSSVFVATKETGLSRTHIKNSIAGHCKCLDNYIWKYKQQY